MNTTTLNKIIQMSIDNTPHLVSILPELGNMIGSIITTNSSQNIINQRTKNAVFMDSLIFSCYLIDDCLLDEFGSQGRDIFMHNILDFISDVFNKNGINSSKLNMFYKNGQEMYRQLPLFDCDDSPGPGTAFWAFGIIVAGRYYDEPESDQIRIIAHCAVQAYLRIFEHMAFIFENPKYC